MKILMISGTFPPRNFGGITTVSYNLAKRLVSNGHEVTVFTTDLGNDERRRLKIRNVEIMDGMTIHYFKNISNFIAFKYRIFLPIGITIAICRNITNFDMVHIHGFRSIQDIIVHYYAQKNKIPYVIHGHGSISRMSLTTIKKIFDILFGYRIIRDAYKLIAVSKEEKEHYIQLRANSRKTHVVYNAMDTTAFKSIPEYGIFRKKYGIDKKIILYLGRINKLKGIDFAIRAFSRLLEDMDNVIFVIAGTDDGYKNEIDLLIKKLNISDKVIFVGHLDEYGKTTAFVDSDLFVHTVIYMGGVGLAPLEAILYGLPVVVTEECGEVIKDAKCGYFVNYGDVDMLKERMRYIIENPKDAEKVTEQGKKFIESNLSWDQVIEKIEHIYLSSYGNNDHE